jgi:predicted nucleotidyltransferase
MLNKKNILDFLKSQYSYLNSNYNVEKIGLIGSYARDEQDNESDIDLMVEFKPGTEDIFNMKLELKEYLKSNLNHDVDICREKFLKPYVKEHIMKEVLYV